MNINNIFAKATIEVWKERVNCGVYIARSRREFD